MTIRHTPVLLAAALLHTAGAQPRQGIDGTDLLLSQQATLNDTRPTPAPLHDLAAPATRFAVWNFDTMAYDTIRFARHPIPPHAHHAGWAKFLRLWVEERDVQSGRVNASTLDSLALDFGTNLPWAMAVLSWTDLMPAHAALDSAQGVDLLLLDIRDGHDPTRDSTWVGGFMDRCDTKAWTPDGCPWRGSGNQANILYLDTHPQLGTDPAWPGLMSGWLYGRRVSAVFGPGKLPLLEYGVARIGRAAFAPRWDDRTIARMCVAARSDASVRSLALSAAPPHPAAAGVQVLQDRGALFLAYMFTLDQHHERVVDRVDENGDRIHGPPIYNVAAWSEAEGWGVVDLIVKQWNTATSDSMMRDIDRGPSVPWRPPEGLASRDDLIFSFHEANYRGWRWLGVGHTMCTPAMGADAPAAPPDTEAFVLGRGTVHYIDMAGVPGPYSFTLEPEDAGPQPVRVQTGVVYYDGADTLTMRLGWVRPDSLPAWPWALPDSVVAKNVAALVLVGGTTGDPVTLKYTIGQPTATEREPPARGFALEQNYPNPFHPTTTVDYTLTRPGRVQLTVYDLLGREMARLHDGAAAPGTHRARVDATGWASGVYLYRLMTAGGSATRRMVLAR